MASTFQNRLVGSIVFIALIVIFLPDLLDGKKSEYSDQFETIPNKPQVKAIPIAPDFPQAEYDQQMAQAQQPLEDEQPMDHLLENAEQIPPNQAKLIEDKKPEQTTEPETIPSQISEPEQSAQAQNNQSEQFKQNAWVIQLGSFGNKKNVESLVDKLKREGYLVFTQAVNTSNGQLTKVFIGPELDQNKLQNMLPELKKLTNLKGKLVNYQPAQ
ncbi:SPOR domain-containing protein [Catenovulum sp. 2E275]|uniref:SPOR domain-containing protein n=1 Tax=Catenovulum sp. 2E275 TaxID=2980497 RepID=UPI0021D3AA4B|nr:SPOR domain-containing protein [Catenovulum sp. 2E275]MCU4675681.1 SPOR domain-containing protein [Catenovulum sp. 2E275]